MKFLSEISAISNDFFIFWFHFQPIFQHFFLIFALRTGFYHIFNQFSAIFDNFFLRFLQFFWTFHQILPNFYLIFDNFQWFFFRILVKFSLIFQHFFFVFDRLFTLFTFFFVKFIFDFLRFSNILWWLSRISIILGGGGKTNYIFERLTSPLSFMPKINFNRWKCVFSRGGRGERRLISTSSEYEKCKWFEPEGTQFFQ